MKECSWLLINGWINEHIFDKNSEFERFYPLVLNEVILRFLGVSNTLSLWQKNENCAMPISVYQFGYVLYKNRIILTFGGRNEDNEVIDNIFYIDLLHKSRGWKECKIKCPKASTYNAILMKEDEFVHIVPFYVDKDHFSIPINKLLPKKLIEQVSVDVIVHSQQQNCEEFGAEIEKMLKMQQRSLRNKLILCVLIGCLLIAIGLILYFIALPEWIGISVIFGGVLVIFAAFLYHRLFEPQQQSEYLLF